MDSEAFDSLIQFLVDSASLDDTSVFSPTPVARERLNALAKVIIRGDLTPQQREGVERVIQLERFMQLAKARHYCHRRGISPLSAFEHVPRSGGHSLRCDYCLMHAHDTYFPLGHEHIVGLQQGGISSGDNMAYSCAECRLRRGADSTARTLSGKEIVLFQPHRQRWGAHFCVMGGVIEPLTRIGEVTAQLLDFNDATRVKVRCLLAEQRLYPRR